MTPVTQTTFYDATQPPEKQRGNCLTAVVASLLDLPIEDVPNFVQEHVDTDGAKHWWESMHAFVASRGYGVYYLRSTLYAESLFPDPDPGEFYAVSGVSPRDPAIFHVVIYRDGEMVHDPHPDRTGLVRVTDEYFWTLRPSERAS